MIAPKTPPYILIIGPTGSGKSHLAHQLALRLQGEIVGCDSVQVYRGFDVGSAKPTKEEMAEVPHHLIDVADPAEDFDAAKYARLARAAITDIVQRRKLPIVVGGTGLYVRSLWGYGFHELPSSALIKDQLLRRKDAGLYKELELRDPARAKELHPNDLVRIRRALEITYLLGKPVSELTQGNGLNLWAPRLVIKLQPSRLLLDERIYRRTKLMLKGSWMSEVEALLRRGVSPLAKPMQSIGYQQICQVLGGTLPPDELEAAIHVATRQYAKRQLTWFRPMPADLVWDFSGDERALLERVLQKSIQI